MIISVVVKTNARQTSVEKVTDRDYRVAVKAAPIEGKANAAVVSALAEHFSLPKSKIQIIHGQRGKKKLVEIDDGNK